MAEYKKLIVWERAVNFCTAVYKTTSSFPESEKFGLCDQLRRASVSIPSNIAEGSKRSGDKEFCQYLRISHGSGAEIETQLLIAKNLGYISEKDLTVLLTELDTIMKMIGMLIKKISP
ncbi:MAG: four helix bundle protein [Candidatus Paceibacterota bacterium]